jgi:hypothetical protein
MIDHIKIEGPGTHEENVLAFSGPPPGPPQLPTFPPGPQLPHTVDLSILHDVWEKLTGERALSITVETPAGSVMLAHCGCAFEFAGQTPFESDLRHIARETA